jgi:hypothetical protein
MGDQPTLAHAGDHCAAFTTEDQLHSTVKGRSHWTGNAIGECSQGLCLNSDHIFADSSHKQ